MACFALVTLQPPGYPHVAAFTEIRLLLFYSLCDLGHDVVLATNRFPEGATPIVFGAHLISEDFPVNLPASALIFNTEQLMEEGSVWSKRIIGFANQHRIWDYASANLQRLRDANSVARVHRLRLGYHRELERVPSPRTDNEGFLFYGSISPMREQILARIELSERLQIQAFFGVYGWQRDGLLARCRAVLNLHAHSARLLEWPRILHLVANAVPCIALLHPETVAEDNQLSYVVPSDEASPTADLERWFQVPEQLRAHAEVARERFRDQEPQHLFTAALLDQSFASGFVPASGPVKKPGWVPCPLQHDPDPLWYQHTYYWICDPRSMVDFHRQEGMLRQFHPDPSFIQAFRSPLQLPPGLSAASSHRIRCAVVLHMHSEQKARLFFASFGCHLAKVADFFATTSSTVVQATLYSLARDYGIKMEVCIVDNRGRDIPSKYIVFNEVIQSYDLCLFSHGKESDLQWFHDHNFLLAGSLDRVYGILDLFAAEPDLGLLFPDYLPSLFPHIGWGTMRRQVDQLLATFGFNTGSIELLEFPAGGFFWARPKALGLLHGLHLTFDDLPQEPLGPDNTMLHALERLPCLSCEAMGMRWEKLSRQVMVSSPCEPTITSAPEKAAPSVSADIPVMELTPFELLDAAVPCESVPELDSVAALLKQVEGPIKLMHFHHFDHAGYLPQLWRELLKSLLGAGFILVVTTCSGFDVDALSFLVEHSILALRRPNRGQCIAAYQATALLCYELICQGVNIEQLLLMNDSILPCRAGGVALNSLESLLDLIRDDVPVLAGFTDSFENGFHLQSYALAANRCLLADVSWPLFWSSLTTDLPKAELVLAGEVGLSVALRSVGVSLRAVYPLMSDLLQKQSVMSDLDRYAKITIESVNPSLYLAHTLVDAGFPFVKKMALFDMPSGMRLISQCLQSATPEYRVLLAKDFENLLLGRVNSLPIQAS